MDPSSSKSISALLDRMVASDTDYRFMAMNDLINELQAGTLRLDGQNEKKVVTLVLRLLRDPSGEVQSLAVKSLGPLVSKVQDQQVISIVQDLVSKMEKGNDDQLRGICSIGLKTVVNALPAVSDTNIIQSAIRESLGPLLRMVASHPDVSVRVEACEVLAELINHFGSQLSNHHLDLLDCLLVSMNGSQNPLRKRATQAIGALAWTLPQPHLTSLIAYLVHRLHNAPIFNRKGGANKNGNSSAVPNALLQRPHLASLLEQPLNADVVKTLMQCLNMVVRHLLRAADQLQPVLQLLTYILHQPATSDSDMDDIYELAIQILETLIRSCPRAVLSQLAEIISLLDKKLQYNPNYEHNAGDDDGNMMCVDGNNGDMDDDDEEADEPSDDEDYSDDEDSSWKVRRAAARALEAAVLTFSERTADFYVTIAPLLIRRFNDNEDPVKLSVFSCFGALLRQTRITSSAGPVTAPVNTPMPLRRIDDGLLLSTALTDAISSSCLQELQAQLKDTNSAQSHLLALLPSLCRAIHRQASVSRSRKARSPIVIGRGAPGIQHAAFMLNRDLALALPGYLTAHMSDILSLIHTYSQDLTINNAVKVDMINLVVLLLTTHSAESYQANLEMLTQLAIWAMNDSFYRVSLEGLELTQLLSAQRDFLNPQKHVNPLFTPLSSLLEANDRDLELKEKAVITTAVFISHLGDLISGNLDKYLQMIYRRLTNELTRLSAVRAIHIIAMSSLPLNLNSFLPVASDELATLLSKSDRLLRVTTLRCLYTIWSKQSQLVGSRCLDVVLELSPKLLISELDLQTAQLAVHLICLLLESGSKTATAQTEFGQKIDQFVRSDAFMQPLMGLAYSPLLRGQALDAMLRLMRTVGQRAGQADQDYALISLFLSRLLAPLDGSGLMEATGRTSQRDGQLHRDALPSMSQCVTELLAQLPSSSSAKLKPGTIGTVGEAINRLIAAVRNPKASVTVIYLNLLILGELGRKLDLSARVDLRDIFVSCVCAPTTPLTQAGQSGASPNLRPSARLAISEEVKPAAALGLGRMVVGRPETLLPFLMERISEVSAGHAALSAKTASGTLQQLYHMLQALREVLVNLAGSSTSGVLKTHLDAIWSLLIANSGSNEEGTRTLVAECLGRLVLVSPRQLLTRLRQQLNSPEASSSACIRCTLVTAVKFIVVATDLDQVQVIPNTLSAQITTTDSLQSDNQPPKSRMSRSDSTTLSSNVLLEVDTVLRTEQPSPLLDFLRRLADLDMVVRRAALVALNTAAHHRPSLVRPLLNWPLDVATGKAELVVGAQSAGQTTLLRLLYTETVVRPELIREVEMGPFRHKEDDGLDLRKCAFECMSTLLENCLDKIVMADFLEALINGCKDHTDIKLLAYQMVQQITRVRPLEISAKMEALAVPLRTVLMPRPKEDQVKQEMEKMEELSRSAISVIAGFKAIEDIDKNRCYLDLLRQVDADPTLKKAYLTALSTESSGTFASAQAANKRLSLTGSAAFAL